MIDYATLHIPTPDDRHEPSTLDVLLARQIELRLQITKHQVGTKPWSNLAIEEMALIGRINLARARTFKRAK